MFNEFSIATTAISSFNNAALINPYFFAIAVLSLPLFYMIYIYAHDILSRLKWENNLEGKVGFWSVLFLTLWLLLFGGNYAVIRDGISLLPIAIAIVLFVSMIYVTNRAIKFNYLNFFKDKKTVLISFLLLLALTVFSAKPDLYGLLLQISAVFCGIIVGARLHKNISDIVISTIVFGMMAALILMQPEYFRFGQLGNLTIIHLGALFITGFFAVTTLITKYIKTKSKIYESAYVKLKWLFRIISALAAVLFVSTESVPVFLGLLAAVSLTEALTIYHSNKIQANISKYSWALTLISFGVLIMCPVISVLGMIYLVQLNKNIKTKDFLDLL